LTALSSKGKTITVFPAAGSGSLAPAMTLINRAAEIISTSLLSP
jgi:hypothetical protein